MTGEQGLPCGSEFLKHAICARIVATVSSSSKFRFLIKNPLTRPKFIDAVNLYNLRKIEDSSAKHAGGPRIERQLNGSEKTYRDFIFFKHFYFNDFPIIICEGKTDNVYLKFAIKALASEFTNLGEKSVEGEINLKL